MQVAQFECPGTEALLSHPFLFWFLALGGSKNGLPSMKAEKVEIFLNKMGLAYC